MNKYLFIDESGDPGNSTQNGSSKHFVMVAILFDDILEMESLSVEIKKLARKLFKNDYHEFHFVNERNVHRLEFFKLVSSFNFKIIVSSHSKHIAPIKENIYQSSLSQICKTIHNDSIIYNFKFDGTVSKSYKFAVEKELRSIAKNNFNVNKIKFANSKNDSLIQLADMCAGLIRRRAGDENKLTDHMFSFIKNKILN